MLTEQYHFAGKVAVVTGGRSGIGAATAMLLAQLGADVAIASRSAEPLEETAARIAGETGRRILAIPTDVREEAEAMRLIARTVGELGRIDILVNNAGGTILAPLKDVTTRAWDRCFALNTDSAYFCSREAARHFMAQRSGAIVNTSSMAGINGTRASAPYSAAKAALQMYTRVAAAEWGPYGIRVNCVAPGMILSSDDVEAHLAGSNIDMATGIRNFPLRRAGRPEEVARAIVFLASDAASYISGETLAVNGGPVLGGPSD